MRYIIKEKVWSLGDTFNIFGEHETPVFQVKGKAISWGNKLFFQDMDGNELAYIAQKFGFKPKYGIERDGEIFAEMVQEFRWFKKEFTLDIPGPNNYSIIGEFWKHNFDFIRFDRVVAHVSKKAFSWADSYTVDIDDDEDDISILCACIVIDKIFDASDSSSIHDD